MPFLLPGVEGGFKGGWSGTGLRGYSNIRRFEGAWCLLLSCCFSLCFLWLCVAKTTLKKIPTRQVWSGSCEGQPVWNRPYIRGLRGGLLQLPCFDHLYNKKNATVQILYKFSNLPILCQWNRTTVLQEKQRHKFESGFVPLAYRPHAPISNWYSGFILQFQTAQNIHTVFWRCEQNLQFCNFPVERRHLPAWFAPNANSAQSGCAACEYFAQSAGGRGEQPASSPVMNFNNPLKFKQMR